MARGSLVAAGRSFVPAVVDAFLEAVHKRPEGFGVAEKQALAD
jgi:hypothetical protein